MESYFSTIFGTSPDCKHPLFYQNEYVSHGSLKETEANLNFFSSERDLIQLIRSFQIHWKSLGRRLG